VELCWNTNLLCGLCDPRASCPNPRKRTQITTVDLLLGYRRMSLRWSRHCRVLD
jgi:hypothetical protein